MKFKIGDRVRIIDCSEIEPYELNKIGTIVKAYDSIRYIVDMGRPRRPSCSDDNETCWWLRESSLELCPRKNEQLLFPFMT